MRRNITVRIECNLAWIETWLCAMLAAVLFWKGILPGWRILHTDFPNYYLVARLLREGYSVDRVYDWVWLQRIKDHWGIDQPLVGFAGLTPFSALPMIPLSFFSALTAKRLWIFASLLTLGATAEVLHRVTALGRRRVWLLCLLCVFPLCTSFLSGQMHLLVLALLVFAYALNRKQKHFAAGVCLSIAGMLKIYPFLFAAYFLWKKQWAALLAMCSAAVILFGLGMWAVGPGIVHTYLTEVLPRSLTGEVLDPYNAQSGSMAALMHRLFIYEPQFNQSPLRNSPQLYSLLYPAWQVAVLAPLFLLSAMVGREHDYAPLQWAAWTFALLILSPVPASYHFVVTVFSVVLLTDFLWKRRKRKLLALALGLYCLMSLIEFIPLRVGFSRLWIAIVFYTVLLCCLGGACTGIKWISRRAALVYGTALVLWAAGALSYQRHFDQLGRETQRRLLPMPPAYLSTGLHQSANGYVLTRMSGENYAVIDQTGRPVARELSDTLSSAATPDSTTVVVEAADRSGSHLVAVKGDHSTQSLPQDGESPAISPDGVRLAFLREERGRGSLWITSDGNAPVRLTAATYDVRNFAFAPSGWIVFAATVAGHRSLFSLIPGNSPTTLLPNLPDTDSPAVSPDERRIAYTRRIHDRWQLEYLDRKTGERQTLTTADCNAYSPQWLNEHQLAYASDCGRGLGLTALSSVPVEPGRGSQ